MNRRKFFKDAALSGSGVLLGQGLMRGKEEEQFPDNARANLMDEVRKYRKIDAHAHVFFTEGSAATQIDFADRLKIEKLVVSCPMRPHSEGNPEEFRKCNDLILTSVKDYPDQFIGQMTLNPAYPKEALEEIARCMDAGMVGLKLYNHIKINDPLFYPIIEKFIDLKMIILMHSAIGYSRVKLNEREPKSISLPEDFVDVAKRYPEAMFQYAHIGGGIDWENSCKILKDSSNVYVDVSGSNNVANMIDFAMKYIGEDRLLFGCDSGYYQGVGHMISAKLTDAQRRKIFFDNYNNILKKSGNHVD